MKIVDIKTQLCCSPEGVCYAMIVALCEDGSLWYINPIGDSKAWIKLPEIKD